MLIARAVAVFLFVMLASLSIAAPISSKQTRARASPHSVDVCAIGRQAVRSFPPSAISSPSGSRPLESDRR